NQYDGHINQLPSKSNGRFAAIFRTGISESRVRSAKATVLKRKRERTLTERVVQILAGRMQLH
ncbi:MAG: hypothetical protein LBT62_07890, partial [Deltaproteobacteria bacterium]|nr:hypothetical protein [Deltaproteobacteria bacterium]